MRKFLTILACALGVALLALHSIGKGWWSEGTPVSAPVTAGPRILAEAPQGEVSSNPTILFGDLHTHTNFSLDAYLFNTDWMKGAGMLTPADACDFARYCAALDFWSINDHAESLTPSAWADTVSTIQRCNDNAGDPANPDMVSFVGWEWSNVDKKSVPNHYGHKNVVFREWEEGRVPTRPIAARTEDIFTGIPAIVLGMLGFSEGIEAASDFGKYYAESISTPACSDDVSSTELPVNCREAALTPTRLYQKLDEWGFDSLVIPHGLSWGTTNPLTADFRSQLAGYEQRYEKLLEVYSGHGNSELFIDFERVGLDEGGNLYCPEAAENFTPCCRQAGKLARERCDDPGSASCDTRVDETMWEYAAAGALAGRALFPDASPGDWEGCGQLGNSFQPPSMYVPKMAAQYNLAVGFDEDDKPRRAKFGLIGSSDNHLARPGGSYKEENRLLRTDSKDLGDESFNVEAFAKDKESGSFYYTGGLVAVHANGRHRDAIWDGLSNRNVYATSGNRMMVWFDLLNGPSGGVPMGSEVVLEETPKFRVSAYGEIEQKSGCPDYAVATLGEKRLASLCGGECYHPAGERRKSIDRIEIVRIRPQVHPDEKISPLIEDAWRVFECPADGQICSVEFEDPDYVSGGRSALYYARVIQEAESLINGDPFGCEYDEAGVCVQRNYCIGSNAKLENDCLGTVEPRAWTSPIFLQYGDALTH